MDPIALEVKYASKVEKYLDRLEKYPPVGVDITPMVGQKGKARVRINDYRVVIRYDYKEKVVYIETIDTREDVYRK